jgi:hypothetical protein
MVDRATKRRETGGGPREVLLPSGQAAGRWYFPPPLCADDSKSCRAQPSDTYKSDYLPCITHARDRRIWRERLSRSTDREMAQVAPPKWLSPWPLPTAAPHSYLVKALLSPWPLERPANWAARVNTPLTAKELSRVRVCIKRGQPYGDDGWVRQTVNDLGLEHTVRPEGRPRKAIRSANDTTC